ncbi:helix-turn-helix domain-containing protein [Actinomadura violacea]|uniref:Helix-turn-helix domain-containing protein n=1 Tax=Actinomadura violacea TaxID=2819934 RepID=A0ABS3RNF6_9ACTN|nr:helix-turn-helix domain-containing protein [Actinomadura violacea]MBO2458262.1 helix-turn-helix domain-containing protein [Actinomadura violacea]
METTAEFARLLKELKERSGRSYEELSRTALTSRSTLHRYCAGKTVPSDAETLSRIARACGADRRETHRLIEAWMAVHRDEPVPQAPPPPPAPDIRAEEPRSAPSPTTPVPRAANVMSAARGTRLVKFAAVALAVAITAVSSLPGPLRASSAPQQVHGPSWSVHPRPVDPSMFGVTINSDTGEMPSFRVGSVRFWDSGTRWSNLEPERGRYDWATLDRLVAGAERGALEPMFVLGGTPGWAAPNAPRMPYPDGARAAAPDDLGDWEGFVRALVRRYKGRLAAYEVWVNGSDRRFFNDTTERLAEMTKRASRVIREIDPKARVVCPSMGALWRPETAKALRRFADLGGYDFCDAASVKLHQRRPADPPETMLEPLLGLDAAMHKAGVHPDLWSTGTTHELPLYGPLDQDRAANYAARFYLTGMYATTLGIKRMYFYNWGSTRLPIVLQGVGGTPTGAALAVEHLQRWLTRAKIHACGHGLAMGLPANVWQCEFVLPGGPAVIRWTHTGTADTVPPPGARAVQRLDGGGSSVHPEDSVRITERPVLITIAPPSGP